MIRSTSFTLLPVQVEDLSALDEDKLHDLVLVHHVDRHISCVQLGPHQCWPEHDADALSGHQVLPGKRQNSENRRNKNWMLAQERRVYQIHNNFPLKTMNNDDDVFSREVLCFLEKSLSNQIYLWVEHLACSLNQHKLLGGNV